MTDVEGLEPAPRRDNQDIMLFGQTPSQTVGPFFHYGLPWKGGADLVGASELGARPELFAEEHWVLHRSSPTGTPRGEVVEIAGRVVDAEGAAVPDAMIEIWQADASGQYPGMSDRGDSDPHFSGFGRSSTDDEGMYRFRTILPGRVPSPDGGLQAPHIAMSVFGRGIVKRLATRLYFAGSDGLENDPVLRRVPPERRATLVAHLSDGAWQRDIVLGGAGETVFFDL